MNKQVGVSFGGGAPLLFYFLSFAKYESAILMTFGAKIVADMIVGIAINPKAMSKKFMASFSLTADEMTMLNK